MSIVKQFGLFMQAIYQPCFLLCFFFTKRLANCDDDMTARIFYTWLFVC